MKQICRNCKHFDPLCGRTVRINDGSCNYLGSNTNLVNDAVNDEWITFEHVQNPQFVFVGDNFGCIHWQAKTGQREGK